MAAGRFAIPGLFDFHVHSGGYNQAAFLAYGITSVRDTGGSISWMNAMKDRGDSSGDPVPRYFFSGEIFEDRQPYWGDYFLQIHDEKAAREHVRRFKERNADFVKVYPSLPWTLQNAVADEARALGLPVVGHGMNVEEITKGATRGYFSLEHNLLPEAVGEDVLRLLSLSGTRWDPTMAVEGADALLLRKQPERLADPKLLGVTTPDAIQFALFGSYSKTVGDTPLTGSVARLQEALGRAFREGVKLHGGGGTHEMAV